MTLAARHLDPAFASAGERKSAENSTGAARVEEMSLAATDSDKPTFGRGSPNSLDFGDQASAYHLTKLIAAADEKGARVFGIVGAHRGAGTSEISRRLAGAFAMFGRTTTLVDASDIEMAEPRVTSSAPILELQEAAIEVRTSLYHVDLANLFADTPITADDLAMALTAAGQTRQTIIVDLPPIVLGNGAPNPAVAILGNACNLVFLICLSGELRRKDLIACIDTCKVMGLRLDGMILNDWRLPGHQLLER